MKKLLVFFVVFFIHVGITARAEAAGPPPPQNGVFGACAFFGWKDNTSTSVTNNFTIDATAYSITYDNPIDSPTAGGGAFHLFKMEPSSLSPNASQVSPYYLYIYGPAGQNNAVVVYHAATKPAGAKSNDVRQVKDGFWVSANGTESGLASTVLGSYVAWIYSSPVMTFKTGASTSALESSDVGHPTTHIFEKDANGKVIGNWYYVANVVWTTDVPRIVYRKAEDPKQYLRVYYTGAVEADYTEPGPNWHKPPKYAQIDNFQELPEPQIYQVLSATVDFTDLLNSTDTNNKITQLDLTNYENMTFEIRLGANGVGPFVNRVFSGLTDSAGNANSPFTQARGEFSRVGVNTDIRIITATDAATLNIPSNLLVTSFEFYAHKGIGAQTATAGVPVAPYLEAAKTLSLVNDFHASTDIPTRWVPNTPLVLKASKVGTLKHPGDEEETGTFGSILNAAKNAPNAILQAIFDALRSIGTIIQNFIIYIVSWAITIASRAVPI